MRSNASAYIRVSQQILLLHLILLYQKYPLFKNCKDLFHDFELKVIMRVGTWLTPHTISTVHHRALTRPNLVLVKHIPTNKNKCNVKISFFYYFEITIPLSTFRNLTHLWTWKVHIVYWLDHSTCSVFGPCRR